MSEIKTGKGTPYRFTAVYERRGRWYVGYVEEVPGVNTQGRTLREARASLEEALKLILEANRELAARHPPEQPALREPIIIKL